MYKKRDNDDPDDTERIQKKLDFSTITPSRLASKSVPNKLPITAFKLAKQMTTRNKVQYLSRNRSTRWKYLWICIDNDIGFREEADEEFFYQLWFLFYRHAWDFSSATRMINRKLEHTYPGDGLRAEKEECTHQMGIQSRDFIQSDKRKFGVSYDLYWRIFKDEDSDRSEMLKIIFRMQDMNLQNVEFLGLYGDTQYATNIFLHRSLLKEVHIYEQQGDVNQDDHNKAAKLIMDIEHDL